MLAKVRHLVRVEEVGEADAEAKVEAKVEDGGKAT